jgi:hypothetical protein
MVKKKETKKTETENETETTKTESKIKKSKPKRPLTGFFRFKKEISESVKKDLEEKAKEYTDEKEKKKITGVTTMAKVIGIRWRKLPRAQQEKYNIMYKEEKPAYDAELAKWESENGIVKKSKKPKK